MTKHQRYEAKRVRVQRAARRQESKAKGKTGSWEEKLEQKDKDD